MVQKMKARTRRTHMVCCRMNKAEYAEFRELIAYNESATEGECLRRLVFAAWLSVKQERESYPTEPT